MTEKTEGEFRLNTRGISHKARTFGPVIIVILAVLLPYWRLTTMRGILITDDIFTSDIADGTYPGLHYIGQAIRNGEAPLWFPHIYSGFPAFASGGVFYPPHLLLFGLLPSLAAINIAILLMILTAGIGMYFYAKEVGAGLWGALAAAVSFAYSGFVVSHLKHIGMVEVVSWFPVGLYLIERALKRENSKGKGAGRRSLLALAAVFAMQNLAGFPQATYYAGIVYVLYFLVRIRHRDGGVARVGNVIEGKQRRVGKVVAFFSIYRNSLVAWFFLALFLGMLVSAVQLVPTAELVSHAQRAGGVSYQYATRFNYDPSSLMNLVYAQANGDVGNMTYTGHGIFWEDYGYAGFFILVLAVFAAVREWRKWPTKFFVVSLIVAIYLVLGKVSPLYAIAFRVVPGMSLFRFPTRFLFLVDASLAVLAALGITRWLETIKAKSAGRAWIVPAAGIAFVVVIFSDLVFFQMRQNAIADARSWLAVPTSVASMSREGLFRVYSPEAEETHIACFYAAKGWQGDLGPFLAHREFVQVNSNILYDVDSPDGYAALTPNYIVDVWGDMNRRGFIFNTFSIGNTDFSAAPAFIKLLNMFNVKYLILAKPYRGSSMKLVERGRNFLLYENPTVLPRAYVVGGYRLASNPDEARRILLSGDYNPSMEAILYERPRREISPGQAESVVKIEKYAGNSVRLQVSMAGPGLLVLADSFYPGWAAEVDGAKTPILKANLCQRAIFVPAGNHTVRFRFRPNSLAIGLAVTVLGIAALGAMFILAGRKGRTE